MSNLREVKEDILKEWINFREEDLLRYVTEQNRKYVQKQLEKLDHNFMDYFDYWCEKYFRNGFVDGVQIIINCINS